MTRAVEFLPKALEHLDDVGAVAKVLSAHVRATGGGGLRREVIVHGSRIRYAVDSEQITVLDAEPVPDAAS